MFLFALSMSCMTQTQSTLSTQITDEAGAVIPFAAVGIGMSLQSLSRSEADAEGLMTKLPTTNIFAVVSTPYLTTSFTGILVR